MALQLILGNAGAGKSHYIFEKIIQESMEHPTKQYLIIVPEQFTMQTQKDLVMMHPHHDQILLSLHGKLLRNDHQKLSVRIFHGLRDDLFKQIMGFSCSRISQNQL